MSSARILGIWGVASRSHTHVFTSLTTELAARGHELITITPFPIHKNITNYREIHVKAVQDYKNAQDGIIDKNGVSFMVRVIKKHIDLCDEGLQIPEVQELIKINHKDKFDLIISTIFFSDCYLGFVHKFEAPLIFISPGGHVFGSHEFIGDPDPWSHVPAIMLPYTDRMNFQERFLNTLFGLIFKATRWYINSLQDNVMRRHFGSDVPFVGDLQRNASLMLLNTHVSLSYPRPTVPNVIYVGGMHVKPPKELPKVSGFL